MSSEIELLTTDDDGHAIPGPRYPLIGVVKWLDRDDHETVRLAYPHKFFSRDKNGKPMPETLVMFLVPDWLCDGTTPSRRALELVVERMGWSR